MSIARSPIAAALTAAVMGSPAAAGPFKTFKDWAVACSDPLTCTVSIYRADGRVVYFGLERGPRANAPVVLFVAVNGELDRQSDIVLSVPPLLYDLVVPVSSGRLEEGVWRFADPLVIDAVLPAMKRGTRMRVVVTTDAGFSEEFVSLAGVRASLRFMDEAQGRDGNRDALEAVGDGEPASAITRVTELNASAGLPVAVRDLWAGAMHQCADDESDLLADFGGRKVDLGEGSALFILPCGLPGAYNQPFLSLAFDASDGTARALMLPVMRREGPTLMDLAYNVDWDDRKSQLSALFKGRGLGDCGASQVWQWDGSGPYGQFMLVEERIKDDCDGEYGEWPRVWPIE